MKIYPGKKMTEKRRDAKLKQLGEIRPFVTASLVKIHRKCGNKTCRCASGEGHPAHLLTMKVRGKTKSVYVPIGLVDEVKIWVDNHKRLKKIIREVSNQSLALIHKHVPESRAARKKTGRKSKT